jgi:hypothetical protein
MIVYKAVVTLKGLVLSEAVLSHMKNPVKLQVAEAF